jgi:hypothetical protein
MGAGVDAQREPAGDTQSRLRKPGGKPVRRIPPASRGIATAHHGDLWLAERARIAEHVKHRGRVRRFAQQRGVSGIDAGEQLRARLLEPRQVRGQTREVGLQDSLERASAQSHRGEFGFRWPIERTQVGREGLNALELLRGEPGSRRECEAAMQRRRRFDHRASLKRKGQPEGWPYLVETSRNCSCLSRASCLRGCTRGRRRASARAHRSPARS